MPSLQKLIGVFEQSRKLLEDPENDFLWSSWNGCSDAVAEIDGVLIQLRSGIIPGFLSVLFAPTGPMQEVSITSGWAEQFVDLADAFDAVMASEDTCPCLEEPSTKLQSIEDLGADRWMGEVEIFKCPDCGQLWLRYFYEHEAFTGSGRWFLGAISPKERELTNAENAKATLEKLNWYYCGGSYYDGKTGKTSGRIMLRR